ncbi:MAG: NAD-binding protein, partial [Chloroflexota bacterium]
TNTISNEIYSLILAIAVLTMILTPFLTRAVEPLYRLQKRFLDTPQLDTVTLPEGELTDHIVIIGAGRVGQYVARVLYDLQLPFVAIEINQQRVDECREQGFPVIYGDGTQEIVLEAAAISEARLLLATAPSIIVTRAAAAHAQRLNPGMHIVARAEGPEQLSELHEAGIYEVVQPEFEAGLEITRQALLHVGFSAPDIQQFADAVRQELYAPLYQLHPDYSTVSHLQNARQLLQLHWVTLPADSPLVEKSLAQCEIRQNTGASIVALLRNGNLIPNPAANTRLEAGDMVAVLGDLPQYDNFLALAGVSVQPHAEPLSL